MPSRLIFPCASTPAGTVAIFPKVATDGSVKADKSERSLTVVPYPRDREFTVQPNLRELAPGLDSGAAKVSVRALAAGTREDLGEIPFTIEDAWLTFRTRKPRTGQHVAYR